MTANTSSICADNCALVISAMPPLRPPLGGCISSPRPRPVCCARQQTSTRIARVQSAWLLTEHKHETEGIDALDRTGPPTCRGHRCPRPDWPTDALGRICPRLALLCFCRFGSILQRHRPCLHAKQCIPYHAANKPNSFAYMTRWPLQGRRNILTLPFMLDMSHIIHLPFPTQPINYEFALGR